MQLKRERMAAALFANLTPCLIDIEASGSAHFGANTLTKIRIYGSSNIHLSTIIN